MTPNWRTACLSRRHKEQIKNGTVKHRLEKQVQNTCHPARFFDQEEARNEHKKIHPHLALHAEKLRPKHVGPVSAPNRQSRMHGEVVRHDHHHRQDSKQLNVGLSFR